MILHLRGELVSLPLSPGSPDINPSNNTQQVRQLTLYGKMVCVRACVRV